MTWPENLKKFKIRVTVISVVIGALDTIPKGFGKGIRWLRNQRSSGDHLVYSIVKICQNTEKSPGDLRNLARELKKVLEYESNSNITYSSWTQNNSKVLWKENWEFEIWWIIGTDETTSWLKISTILLKIILEICRDLLTLRSQWNKKTNTD